MLQYFLNLLGSPSALQMFYSDHGNYKVFIFLGCHSRNLSRITFCSHVCLFFNSSPESDQMVKDKCNNKNFCEVEASNEVFGNPCGETHKYLEVQYHCQAGKEISKTTLINTN